MFDDTPFHPLEVGDGRPTSQNSVANQVAICKEFMVATNLWLALLFDTQKNNVQDHLIIFSVFLTMLTATKIKKSSKAGLR